MDIEFVKCVLSYKKHLLVFYLQMKEKYHKIEPNNITCKKHKKRIYI